ncbi:MAG: helix-turn-helix domain-containing protein [Pseudomonadota bacterium]
MNCYSKWEVDFRQIEPGAMVTEVTVRPGAQVTLLEIAMDRAVHQAGCSPRDVVTLGLPLTPALRRWRGEESGSPGLLTFGSGADFEGVSDPDFVGLTVGVDAPFLSRIADRVGLPIQDELAGRGARPLRRWSSDLQGLGQLGHDLLHNAAARFGEAEQGDFVARLIAAAAEGERFADRSGAATRARAVDRALECLRARAEDALSISELCTAAGASWRTLDRGFRERFGIGPKAYLNRFRLGQVRSDLLRAGPEIAVADAANAWGFWHMGQFAKDYRRMFGELPSETLRLSAQ